MTHREELARAAGFFNGEGCIRHEISPTGHGVRISISQSGILEDGIPDDLTHFLQAVGVGGIRGPYFYEGFGKPLKPKWVYRLSKTANSRIVMEQLTPWLSQAKTLQAAIAFDKWEEYARSKQGTI